MRPVSLTEGTRDVAIWKWTHSGEYSTKWAYKVQFIGRYSPFDTKQIWRSIAQPNIQVFGWLALHEKILTVDNLEINGDGKIM